MFNPGKYRSCDVKHSLQLFSSSYIDSGRNPELFTRHQLEQTLSDYEAVQRKVQAYRVWEGRCLCDCLSFLVTEIFV